MIQYLRSATFSLALAAMLAVVPHGSQAAMSADEYFADGNRLFRDDLYWAALLRYRQAAEEGMDSSVLHYNTGIAHYRAGQHIRAQQSLLKAIADPVLRAGAQYNLGLNAYRLGDTTEALRWFELARIQHEHEKIQRFAAAAIARIRDELAQPDDYEIRAAEREKKREFADLELRLRVGFGADDNVFRTPDQPYIDFNDPALPIVTPEIRSGEFIPVSLSAKYLVNSLPFEGFYVAYRAAGRFYQDENLKNGNEYHHEVSFGNEYRRKEGTRERELYSAFTVAQHDETYYDPDDGGSRIIDGVPIDDRMNYLRYGPEISLRQSHERVAVGANLKAQLWNYDDTLVAPEYDHEYFLLSLYGQYKFAPSTLLRVTAEGYSRRFGNRPSYDLDGNPRIGNPSTRYDYLAVQLTARQRIFHSLWFGFDIRRTERSDAYVGYNDYTRDAVGLDIHWNPTDRFDIVASGEYRLYDYPNAFAFHNELAGPKTQESAHYSLIVTYRITPGLSIVGEGRYWDTISNDTRIQYERNQYALSVRWEQ